MTNRRKAKDRVETTTMPGSVNFFAEALAGEGEEGAGLMMLQVQVHPLPDGEVLFNKLVDAINKAAAEVLMAEGLLMEGATPQSVYASNVASLMPEDDTKRH